MAHRPLHAASGLGPVADIVRRWAAAPSLLAWLAGNLLAERERWFLWLPVALGTGVAVYFALPIEPPVWLGATGLLVAAVLLLWAWWRLPPEDFHGYAPALLGVLVVMLGFAAASWRTHLVGAPVLERRGAYELEAMVLLVEERIRGQRLLLGEPAIEGLERHATPAQIRVSTRSPEPAFEPGDRVRVRALLMPPSPPVEPGGFDFARHAYFQRLGAVGYALSAPELLSAAEQRGWSLGIAALRQSIAERITRAVPGAAGAIGVALLTGLRGALPDQIWDEWAVAGIAHLLSISGLHLALVAGTLFFAVRIALALAPPLALRLPTKKVAALIALFGAFGYLLISGAPVPTQRAFAMTALGLVAIMADRNPFSMRLVAWAAMVVLLLQPESLLGASFQMSFGAVVALIAVYETGVARRPADAGGLDWRLLMYVGGIALTTLVASAATTPFSIHHFSRFPTYGIVTNLIAVPLTGIWIMPSGMLGLLLIPVGLDGPCFVLMGHAIELIIAAAAFVAALPLAQALAPARPDRGRAWRSLDAAQPPTRPPDRQPRRDRRRPPARRQPRPVPLEAGPLDYRQLVAERGPGPTGGLARARPSWGRRSRVRCPRLHFDPRRKGGSARPPTGGDRKGLPGGRPGRQLSASRTVPGRDAADRPACAPPRRRARALDRALRHRHPDRARRARPASLEPLSPQGLLGRPRAESRRRTPRC
jgi:competence protein ComEC